MPPMDYALKFEDTFATLDPIKWRATTSQMFSGYGQEIWDAARATVVSEKLVLSATPDMHAGEVRSRQAFQYGYFECRAKLPRTPGFWPAFWLLTSLGHLDPFSYQEVDAAECNSSNPNRIGMNLHWGVRGNSPSSNGGYSDPLINFQDDFHTYGVLYEPDRIEFYVDGTLRRTWMQSNPALFFDPMEVRLSLSIFGPNQTYAAPPSPATVWPGEFVIDWVRVYQKGVIPIGDTTAPAISITAPLNGASAPRRSRLRVTAVASDNVGVARVDFLVNGAFKAAVLAAPYVFDYNVPAAPNRIYRIEAVAWDVAGNSAHSLVTVRSS